MAYKSHTYLTTRESLGLVTVDCMRQGFRCSFSEEDWLNELAMALKPNAEAEAKMTRTRPPLCIFRRKSTLGHWAF